MAAIAWLGALAHIVVGWIDWRRPTSGALVPVLNLGVALCVLAYWAQKWYGYAVRGVSWYATDQLVPLYALVVAIVAVLTLTGRISTPLPNRVFLVVDGVVLIAAAFFLSFFRMTRLF